MLRRMCALPLRRTGSMAEAAPAASAEPAPATAEPRNWRRVGMVMAVCSGELGEWPEYNAAAEEKHELFTFSSNSSRRAKKGKPHSEECGLRRFLAFVSRSK